MDGTVYDLVENYTMSEAESLFYNINSGVSLSTIQKSKAKLGTDLIGFLNGLLQGSFFTQVNDEGKIHDLPANRACIGDNGEVYDFICGNILCVRHRDDEFDSILESDIAVIEKKLIPLLSVDMLEDRTIYTMTNAGFLSEYKGER